VVALPLPQHAAAAAHTPFLGTIAAAHHLQWSSVVWRTSRAVKSSHTPKSDRKPPPPSPPGPSSLLAQTSLGRCHRLRAVIEMVSYRAAVAQGYGQQQRRQRREPRSGGGAGSKEPRSGGRAGRRAASVALGWAVAAAETPGAGRREAVATPGDGQQRRRREAGSGGGGGLCLETLASPRQRK
jgi:hypothetical protein